MIERETKATVLVLIITGLLVAGCVSPMPARPDIGERTVLADTKLAWVPFAGLDKCAIVRNLDKDGAYHFELQTDALVNRIMLLDSYELVYLADGQRVSLRGRNAEIIPCRMVIFMSVETGFIERVDFPITPDQLRQLARAQSIVMEGYYRSSLHKPWTLKKDQLTAIRRFCRQYVKADEK